MDTQEWIVGEVSKNWGPGFPRQGPILCQLFEQLLETNDRRGYVLHSFELHRMMTPGDVLNETILAVFRRKDRGDLT